jgi:hypothetical protein
MVKETPLRKRENLTCTVKHSDVDRSALKKEHEALTQDLLNIRPVIAVILKERTYCTVAVHPEDMPDLSEEREGRSFVVILNTLYFFYTVAWDIFPFLTLVERCSFHRLNWPSSLISPINSKSITVFKVFAAFLIFTR